MLAWEFGSGLGHVGRLAPIARALLTRGHLVDLMFKDVVQPRTVLGDLPVRLFQSPVWQHRTMGLPQPQVSLAEILLGAGWLTPASLEALVRGWLAVFEAAGTDRLLADYAPTAVLAARVAGIPTASIGIGFYVPPDQAPIPPFRDWEPIQPGRVAHHDQQALDNANAVIAKLGGRPLDRLAEVFRGQAPLLCTWEELDHYRRGALPEGQQYLGPTLSVSGGLSPQWPPGPGPKVFAYLRKSHPEHAAVLQALVDEGCSAVVFMPEVAAGAPAPVTSSRLSYSPGPVNLAHALPHCQLVVCHGGAGVLNEALLQGVPTLLLPQQAEQFLISRRVHEQGAGLNAPQTGHPPHPRQLVRQLLSDPRHRQAAQDMARRHQGHDHAHQLTQLVAALEGLGG
jgi:hypothetical protein